MTLFDAFKNNTRLLIIHPNYRQQKHILANLLKIESLIYVRFDGSELSLDELNEQIYAAYQQNTISEIDLIVLDECDRAKNGDFNDFLRNLLSHIKPTPIVLFSRDLPSLVLEDTAIASISSIWSINPQLMYPDYLAKRRPIVLEVFALGRGYIRVNGVKFDNWRDEQSQATSVVHDRTHKTTYSQKFIKKSDSHLSKKEVFFFLVHKGRVHKEEIFETFWSHLDAKGAANAFQNTKAYLNNQLGFEITDYHDGYYSINSAIELHYDVEKYYDLVKKADFSQNTLADTLYHEANSLYSGNFLGHIETSWAKEQRNKLKEVQAGILAHIARQEINDGNPENALVYWGQAAHFAPQREDVAHQLIHLYLQAEMPCEALTVYNRLYQSLSKYDIVPSKTIAILAEEAYQQCPKS